MAQNFGRGHFIVPDEGGRHRIGGTHDVVGANCPNCCKPLMLHLTLDMSDRILRGVKWPWKNLPLLFCSRCILPEDHFCYRFLSERRVELIEYQKSPSQDRWEKWERAGIGDVFSEVPFNLVAMPKRIPAILKAFYEEELTEEMRAEYYALTAEHRELNRARNRKELRPVNQVLGFGPIRPKFKKLAGDFKNCSICRGSSDVAGFVASVCNNRRRRLRFRPDGHALYFFACRKCRTVNVSDID